MYYLQSRYYSPTMKRFLNADALFIAGDNLTGTNMFAYCGNNPVMYSDTSGMYYHYYEDVPETKDLIRFLIWADPNMPIPANFSFHDISIVYAHLNHDITRHYITAKGVYEGRGIEYYIIVDIGTANSWKDYLIESYSSQIPTVFDSLMETMVGWIMSIMSVFMPEPYGDIYGIIESTLQFGKEIATYQERWKLQKFDSYIKSAIDGCAPDDRVLVMYSIDKRYYEMRYFNYFASPLAWNTVFEFYKML